MSKLDLRFMLKRAREAREGGSESEKAPSVEESLKPISGKRSGDPTASAPKCLKA